MTDNILFVRSDEDEGDPWDDSLLIKAYDAALTKVKKSLSDQHKSSESTSKQREKKDFVKWKKGQACRAKFSEDGVMYEGNILKLLGESALIRFIGYGNTETVLLEDLEPSQGNAARRAQKKEAKYAAADTREHESMETQSECGTATSSSHQKQFSGFKPPPAFFEPDEEEMHCPPPPPPPPGLFHQGRVPDDDETLYSMLMSWYMSGYHTGYYEGRKVARRK